MNKKQEVLLMYLREGRSQREIARMTGIDRKTVRKYIHVYKNKKLEIEQSSDSVQTKDLFFQEAGGVYRTIVYDNMKVAVKHFIGTEKVPPDGLLKLSIYYGFQYRFCNGRGYEKGHVERSVEVIRRKAFAFRDTFATIEEANQYLHEICERLNQKPQSSQQSQTAEESLKQEQAIFLPLPQPFDAARVQPVCVDKYSTVVVDQSHYSVPDHLVGEKIKMKIYSNRVLVFYEGNKICGSYSSNWLP